MEMDGLNVKKFMLMTEQVKMHFRPGKGKALPHGGSEANHTLAFCFHLQKAPPKHGDHYTECPRQIKENNYCS